MCGVCDLIHFAGFAAAGSDLCVCFKNRRLIIKGFFLSAERLFILFALVKVFLVKER